MEQRQDNFEYHDPVLPGFYELLLGRPINELEIQNMGHNVWVSDINSVLERVKGFDGYELLERINNILETNIAIIKCPDERILILSEKANKQ